MSLSDALRQLWPIEPEGIDEDLTVPGNRLDAHMALLDDMEAEMHPATATLETIDRWERDYGLAPDPGDTLETRRTRAIAAMRSTGGLNRPYFIALAAAMGYAVTISTSTPFVCGESVCGDELGVEDIGACWIVTVDAAGPADELEEKFQKLRPAWTGVEFVYTE